MRAEHEDYINELMEVEHVSNIKELEKRFRGRFPGTTVTAGEINHIKKCYCLRRFGTSNFAPKRLAAYQLFESGGTVQEAIFEIGITEANAKAFMQDWRMSRIMDREYNKGLQKTRASGRHEFPGGAMFGSWTKRNTIWKG
ncbi:MAG: hypothetical protein IJ899_14655 [Blautia sp.]|nr:hypothetical protein [Blautia sp.]